MTLSSSGGALGAVMPGNRLSKHIAADGSNGPFTMAYYTGDDIQFHWALAENFTICDNYHCWVMGPTWPNRLYRMSPWVPR